MVFQIGPIQTPGPTTMEYFDFEIFDGVKWVSLNDHLNYRLGGGSFENVSHGRRRHMADSSMYDGDWEVHSTATSVQETVVVNVMGADYTQTMENVQRLREIFSQSLYNCRKTVNDTRETWRCFPAEWTEDHGMVQTHAMRAQMRFSIPRFPKVTYEVMT